MRRDSSSPRAAPQAGRRLKLAAMGLVLVSLITDIAVVICCTNVGGCAASVWGYPVRATREDDLSRPGEGLATVDVSTDVGRLEVSGWDGNDIAVHAAVRVRAHDEARAADLAAQVTVQAVRDGDKLTISPLLPQRGRREQIEVDLTVSLPWPLAEGAAIGASKPAPLPSLTCRTDAGGIYVHDLAASVSTTSDAGATVIRNVCGPVKARCDAGSLSVKRVGGAVDAAADAGRVTVASVAGPVRVRTDAGPIDVSDVKGDPTTKGPAVHAQADVGTIRIEKVTGDVEARTDTGTIKVIDIDGKVVTHTDVGHVTTHNVTGRGAGS